jgi:hypothetical protein
MPEVCDGVDNGAAVADRCPKGLRLWQSPVFLARPIAGCAATDCDKVGGVLQAERLKGCQGFIAGSVALR